MSLPLIAIDARMVTAIPHGIARYVTQIAQGLRIQSEKENLPYEPTFLVNNQDQNHLFQGFRTETLKFHFLSLMEIFEIPSLLKNLRASLYHSPSFSSLWSCPCPSVITIHDLNHLVYGDLRKKIYYQTLLRRFALKSEAILTVSEFSQREISSWLKVPLERVIPIYNALNAENCVDSHLSYTKLVLKKFNLTPGRYFFSLSNYKPHKNLPLLALAYKQFRSDNLNAWPWVVTVNEIPPSPGIMAVGGLPDLETYILLKNAGGMLFPSLYEGFGLPPLEAAAAGIPIAISRIPPHEEGLIDLKPDEILWISPQDFEGWVQAFQKIQTKQVLQPSLLSQTKILERYSTERLGQRMDQIYRRVLKVS